MAGRRLVEERPGCGESQAAVSNLEPWLGGIPPRLQGTATMVCTERLLETTCPRDEHQALEMREGGPAAS